MKKQNNYNELSRLIDKVLFTVELQAFGFSVAESLIIADMFNDINDLTGVEYDVSPTAQADFLAHTPLFK